MEYLKKLIDVYARYGVSTVTSQPEYEQLHAKYQEDSQFLWLRKQLDDMKGAIEASVEPAGSPQKQLQAAIHLLRGYRRRAAERDLFHGLVVAMYATRWDTNRIDYFGQALNAVRLTHDYFLSFTTRHGFTEINPINARYKYFIMEKLPNTFNTRDQNKENLFATAIDQIFSEKCSGYFFPKSEDDTAIVMEELETAMNQSLVVVQIIQSELFDFTEKTNYCFLEWQWARGRFGDSEQHIVYVSGEADRAWEDLVPDAPYRDWHSHAATKRAPPTPLHRTFIAEDIEKTTQFFETLRDRAILGAWIRLERDAP